MLSDLPIYVICLKRDPARVERLVNHLAPFNLNYTIWWGFDGIKMGLATNKPYDVDGHKDIPCDCGCGGQKSDHIGRGQIGCIMSHLSLVKHLLISGYEKALIFEDDIELPDNFKESFETKMAWAPHDWDMIYLDYCAETRHAYINDYFSKMTCQTTAAYMLNKKAMQVIEDHCQCAYRPIDVCYVVEAHPILNVYGFTPPICIQLTSRGRMLSSL